MSRHGRLCVGIDPHSWLLHDWGLPDSAAGARDFALTVVEACAGTVGMVKPQVAFFERFGSAGIAVLEEVIREARSAGLLVIADAKRGDVGSTVAAYAEAWLERGAPLESDAMTISAFQGVGSIAGPIDLACRTGKGLFVLAATSNPEGVPLQQAIVRAGEHHGSTVSRAIVEDVAASNRDRLPGARIGSIGVVIGATLDLADFGLDAAPHARDPVLPVLAPGFGYQGASVERAAAVFGALSPGVIVSESRSVLGAGPEGLALAITSRAEKVKESIV